MIRIGCISKIGFYQISTTFPAAGQIVLHRQFADKSSDKNPINSIIEEIKNNVHKLESQGPAGKPQNVNASRNGIDEKLNGLIEQLEKWMDQMYKGSNKGSSMEEKCKDQVIMSLMKDFKELDQMYKSRIEQLENGINQKHKGSKIEEGLKVSSVGEMNKQMDEKLIKDQVVGSIIKELQAMNENYKSQIEQLEKRMDSIHEQMKDPFEEKMKSFIEQLEKKRMVLKEKGLSGLWEKPAIDDKQKDLNASQDGMDEKYKGLLEELKRMDKKFAERFENTKYGLIGLLLVAIFISFAHHSLLKRVESTESHQLEAFISNFGVMRINSWAIGHPSHPGLDIGQEGLTLTHKDTKNGPITARAEYPFPKLSSSSNSQSATETYKILGYFETKILKNSSDVIIGLCDMAYPLDKPLGAGKNSIGFTPSAGTFQIGGYSTKIEMPLKTAFKEGDSIGIMLISMAGHLLCFAFCNGTPLGKTVLPPYFANLYLFPAVSLCSNGTSIKSNFGMGVGGFEMMKKKE